MGVDAQMFVKTRNPLSEKEVRRLAVDLCEAFGADKFAIGEDWPIYDDSYDKQVGKGRHSLQIIKKYNQDGPTLKPKKGEQFIEVHMWTRYYGPGYERGDLPFIIAVAEWLEIRIPGCEVWYGGDSSGINAELFDKAARSALFEHFVKGGHRAYRGYFGQGRGTQPLCGFCDYAMNNYGGGPGVEFYGCDGCGKKVVRESTGNCIVVPKGKDYFGYRNNWQEPAA